MSESKSNAAWHGLKVGDMVGILGTTTPSFFWKGNDSYIGRIGRIKAFGSGVNEGQCAVFVNGKHWWFPESSLAKISRRGCFRRTKPRRKTANAKHEVNNGTSGAIRLDYFAPPSGEYEVTVSAGAGSEPQPEAPKAEPKFKAGDRVEVCSRVPRWNSLWDKVGAVGTILYFDASDATYTVDFHDGNMFWWCPELVLRHAPAEPSPATESVPEPEKPKFKPFDRVLVKIADKWQPNIFLYKRESGLYQCAYGDWEDMIPYEGNEALAGTTNDPEKG